MNRTWLVFVLNVLVDNLHFAFISNSKNHHLANHAAGKKIDKIRFCLRPLAPHTPKFNVGPKSMRHLKAAYQIHVLKNCSNIEKGGWGAVQ